MRAIRATGLRVVHRGPTDDAELVEVRVLAREAGLRPGELRRLVGLGLLEPRGGTEQWPLFPRDAAVRLARAARLRRDLDLNYAGAILVSELLERIDELEERLAHYEHAASPPVSAVTRGRRPRRAPQKRGSTAIPS